VATAAPKLDPKAIERVKMPANRCAVHRFLETLDDHNRKVVRFWLAHPIREVTAPQILDLIVDAGFDAEDLPSTDQVQCHRSRRTPCRCPRD
jgi:hypothetical protein